MILLFLLATKEAVVQSASITSTVEASASFAPNWKPQTPLDQICTQCPGRLVDVYVKEGSLVKVGDLVAKIEVMKMEHTIRASYDGIIQSVIRLGSMCQDGQCIMTIQRHEPVKAENPIEECIGRSRQDFVSMNQIIPPSSCNQDVSSADASEGDPVLPFHSNGNGPSGGASGSKVPTQNNQQLGNLENSETSPPLSEETKEVQNLPYVSNKQEVLPGKTITCPAIIMGDKSVVPVYETSVQTSEGRVILSSAEGSRDDIRSTSAFSPILKNAEKAIENTPLNQSNSMMIVFVIAILSYALSLLVLEFEAFACQQIGTHMRRLQMYMMTAY